MHIVRSTGFRSPVLLVCLSLGCSATSIEPTGAADASMATTGPADAGRAVVDAGDLADGATALPGDLSIVPCPGARSLQIPPGAPACDAICGQAHCVPSSVVGSNPNFPACPDDGTGMSGSCIPDAMLRLGGAFVPAACPATPAGRSVCAPACFVGAAFRVFASRSTCAGGELCVPCDNPLTGQPTGACATMCVAPDAGADAGADTTLVDADASAGDSAAAGDAAQDGEP